MKNISINIDKTLGFISKEAVSGYEATVKASNAALHVSIYNLVIYNLRLAAILSPLTIEFVGH